ncbi:paraquat-inducible protein B [Bordetella genomosp. 8]|uniref:Paraquat-inducible protein B n=1 Tax=Bordetella genomosp. 8 TaxID=1416806 RepID=A0A1W6YKX6_9BORD|nr:MlaD family protein [Bordetella genomosp. 8]ARP81722.1 paraquat-inducible protein B [Bordetella genomosp. 8]
MAQDNDSGDGPPVGAATITRKKRHLSWIWAVPLVALLAGAALVLRTWYESGPAITITFATAEGIEAGKTQIRYKEVNVGQIEGVRLAEDRSHVIATARLAKEAASLAQQGTNFWVVRPRLGFSGVSGLGTLFSGAYIGVDAPGKPVAGHPKTDFIGLEAPPEVLQDRPGRRFNLQTATLGSLDIGSPVYYRRIAVGQVIGYQLDGEGRHVNVQVFVDAPNDRYVNDATRFWNASGVDVSINAQGLQVRTQSILAVALGGLAFEDFGRSSDMAASDASARDRPFPIFDSEQAARARPDGAPLKVRMRFSQSVRGLSVGAPIDFHGIALGQVDAIDMRFDRAGAQFYPVISGTIYPDRLGSVAKVVHEYAGPDFQNPSGRLLAQLIERGMRGQLRTGNLLTGQLYVALDEFPQAPPVAFTMSMPAEIPTVPNNLDQLQQQLASIAAKIEKIPFDRIADDLHTTLASASRLVTRLDRQVAPEAQAALRQATRAMGQIATIMGTETGPVADLQRTLTELGRTARSLRALADYLQSNPEALLRGRSPDPAPRSRRAAEVP